MANNNAKLTQNLEKRIEALENDSVDENATLTQINKMYTDIEIEVTFSYWLHSYRRCGDTQPLYPARCGTDSYL